MARLIRNRWCKAWFAALVRGPSMVPTLRDGDAVLVRRTTRVRPGDVVVARFRSRPDLLVVKRVTALAGGPAGGCLLAGDNPLVTDDSRAYGPADPIGRVLLRWWPRPTLLPRKSHDHPPAPSCDDHEGC